MDFVELKTGSRFQTFGSKFEKARNAMEVCTIVVTAIKEQQVDIDIQSSQVWFGKNVPEDIWKCRFTYRPMANMAKTERVILVMVFIHCKAVGGADWILWC